MRTLTPLAGRTGCPCAVRFRKHRFLKRASHLAAIDVKRCHDFQIRRLPPPDIQMHEPGVGGPGAVEFNSLHQRTRAIPDSGDRYPDLAHITFLFPPDPGRLGISARCCVIYTREPAGRIPRDSLQQPLTGLRGPQPNRLEYTPRSILGIPQGSDPELSRTEQPPGRLGFSWTLASARRLPRRGFGLSSRRLNASGRRSANTPTPPTP